MPSHASCRRWVAVLAASLLASAPGATVRAQCPSGNAVFGTPIRFDVARNMYFFVSGDFNDDGITDLAVTNGDVFNEGLGSRVNVLIGQGNRQYAAPVAYAVGRNAHGLVTGDFNGDGVLDLAAANKWSDNVSVLIGNGIVGHGNGTFRPAVHYAVTSNPFDLVTADFDRDGILDLATCLNAGQAVAVLRGQGGGGIGNGTFAPPLYFPTSSVSTGLKTGDLDDDGDADLVATEYHTGTIAVLLNTGASILSSASFPSAAHYAAGPQPFGALIADLDEDGFQDIAVANSANGGTAVLRGDGSGTFPTRTMLASGNVGSVVAADFDVDGILDLAAAVNHGNGTGHVVLHHGQGAGGVGSGTFGPPIVYEIGHDAYQMLAGDFDTDGNIDLFVSYNDASGTMTPDPVTLLPGACSPAPPDPRNPVLTDVRDAPNDQGGKVFVTWTASSLDVTGGSVNQYRVWRRIPPAMQAFPLEAAAGTRTTTRLVRPDGTEQIVYWEALATLPAQRLPAYGYTAATTQDSMRHGNPYTAFFVSALTPNLDVFYSSNVDSGYSVDNIRPNRPGRFTGQLSAAGVTLDWDENADPDLAAYRVYRGATPDFVPSDANRIAVRSAAGYLDPGATGAEFYKLSAVDDTGNESDFSVLEPLAVADVGRGAVGFALHGVRPNPAFGSRWTVDLALASGAPARLELIDAGGRRVAVRELDGTPGPRRIGFELEAPLAPGVYLVRLTQGVRRGEVKAAILR